jgi:iron complex transport system permease protein
VKQSLRFLSILVIGLIVLLGIVIANVLVGPTEFDVQTVINSFVRFDSANDAHLVIRDIRLPRSLVTIVVGANLAVAGAVMQGVTRNPLAGPTIMGLSGGASLASLVSLMAWPSMTYNGSMVATFVGAAFGYGCVLAVAIAVPGGLSPARLALAGIVVSAFFSAITQALVIVYAMANTMLYWTIGGVTNVSWEQVVAVLPCTVFGLLGLWLLAPQITILSLGEEVATNLGIRSGRVKLCSTLLVLLLTGAAVAVAGPVGFVGLMVPHLCRMVVGADQRRLLPLCMIAGAALTTLADLISRTALGARGELPLGVVTAVLGAPFFLWLIRSHRKVRLDRTVPVQGRARVCWSARKVVPLALVLLFTVFLIGLQYGRADLSYKSIALALIGQGTPEDHLILWSIRLPRLVFATLVGIGVAVAGALFQSVLRNDLAEPGILGVSSGVSFAIVLLLALLGRSAFSSIYLIPLAGICGAVITTLLIYLLCHGGEHSAQRLLLTGVAVSSVISAITLLLSLQISSDAHAFVVAFGAGSLNAADWNYVAILGSALMVLVPLAWSFSPTLNVLRLGDQTATGLGIAVTICSLSLLTLAVALCAFSLSLAGAMLFLGLIAPHIARRLVGSDHAAIIPVAGLVGATLLIVADTLGATLLTNAEIPAGVFVSVLGAPYFLFLMTRS